MSDLSHIDPEGKIRMVDVGSKEISARMAQASAFVKLDPKTVRKVSEGAGPKGDPLEISRIAGIQAAKRTSELIPLCHQIALSNVEISVELEKEGVRISATARTDAKTGVEMEALTAVTVAGLTVYDMCKAVQKDIEITGIRLDSKTGGKEDYHREISNSGN